ncbi:MAG: hypothetical protein V3U32_03345 [Anaerolineales bacterium]
MTILELALILHRSDFGALFVPAASLAVAAAAGGAALGTRLRRYSQEGQLMDNG